MTTDADPTTADATADPYAAPGRETTEGTVYTVTGGDWATGAILGGAAGAATGALTDSDDIDLNGNNRKKRRRW